MSPYPTDLYVASQTAYELVVVDPPYTILCAIFAIIGLATLLGGFAVVFAVKVGFTRPLHILFWALPVFLGGPFLIVALMTGASTRIIALADSGTLSVSKNVLSVPIGSKKYSFDQVRLIKVGVGDVCQFLYVSLADRPAENLTGCTDRTGYGEVANAMNTFLDANRRSSSVNLPTRHEPQIPEGQ
jgi:hypothetical protein